MYQRLFNNSKFLRAWNFSCSSSFLYKMVNIGLTYPGLICLCHLPITCLNNLQSQNHGLLCSSPPPHLLAILCFISPIQFSLQEQNLWIESQPSYQSVIQHHKHKHNTIIGDIHPSKRILINFTISIFYLLKLCRE